MLRSHRATRASSPSTRATARRRVSLGRAAAVTLLAAALATGVGTVVAPSASAATYTPHQSYVTSLYNDFLGRNPTTSELSQDTNFLDNGGSPSALVSQLANSTAWVANIVNGFYQNTLGRPAEQGGLSYWEGIIIDHESTVAQVAAKFYASDEYFTHLGGGTNSSWVTDLYHKVLHRVPEPGGVPYWVGVAQLHGRTTVAYDFYQSPESCFDRVATLYGELLHRTPDTDGQKYWAGRLPTSGDIALATTLAVSAEYEQKATTRYPGSLSISGSLPGGTVGAAYSATLTASGGTAPDAFSATGLPAGLVISSAGIVTGTPTASGSSTVHVTVTDHTGATATATFTVAIAAASQPLVLSGSLPGGTVGIAYTAALTASGGTAPYSFEADYLPDGLTMATNGTVSGTPIYQGIFTPVTVTVTDHAGHTASHDYSVTIAHSTALPTITGTLPGGTAGVSYSASVGATGGTLPYAFSATGMPDGLFMDDTGSVTGMPTTAGTSTVHITVTDQNDNSGTATQTITIAGPSTGQWTILAAPSGDTMAVAKSTDDSGLVVGTATDTGNVVHAVAWAAGTHAPTTLPAPTGFTASEALAVNASGTIVGDATDTRGFQQPVEWTGTGHTVKVLTLPTGRQGGSALAVNDRGEIAGSIFQSDGAVWLPCAWSLTGNPTILPGPDNHDTGIGGATGINSSGVIIGSITPYSGSTDLVEWSGDLTRTTTVLGLPNGSSPGKLVGINDAGTVTGWTNASGGGYLAVSWSGSASHAATVLTQPNDSPTALPNAITDTGLIAGTAAPGQGTAAATQWTAPTTPSVLSVPFGYSAANILGADDQGDFAGTIIDGTYTQQAVIYRASPARHFVRGGVPARTRQMPQHVQFQAGGGTAPYTFGATGLPPGESLSSSGLLTGAATAAGTFNATINSTDHLGATATLITPIVVLASTLTVIPGPAQGGTTVFGMNDAGTLVGDIPEPNVQYAPDLAVMWDATTHAMTVLPTPVGNTGAEAIAINTSGLIAGQGFDTGSSENPHPVEWNATTHVLTALPLPVGETNGVVTGVNDSGIVVGWVSASNTQVPVEWDATPAHTVTVLPTPTGTGYSLASGINNAGQVVGNTTDLGVGSALEWDATASHAVTVLPTPAGQSPAAATAISTSGVIVGTVTNSSGYLSGYEWAAAAPHTGTSLASPTGVAEDDIIPVAINASGVIVGNSAGSFYESLVLTSAGATPTVLPQQPLGSTQVAAINASGLIAGTNTDDLSGEEHGVLITTSPLPLTISANLAAATVSENYWASMGYSGGFGHVSFTATGLPTWLTLADNGVFTGTPPATGSWTLSVTAVDDAGGTATRSVTITVS